MQPETSSIELLEKTWDGDKQALNALLEQHRPWVWSYVRRNISERIRAFDTSEDVVQDVLRKLFQRGPQFIPRDEHDFRRLVATIVMNRLRDLHSYAIAERRDRDREAGESPTQVGVRTPSLESPSQAAQKEEERGLVQLALELIDPEDAHVIQLVKFEGMSFPELAQVLDVQKDAARMRLNRAVTRLGTMMRKVQAGDLSELAPDL